MSTVNLNDILDTKIDIITYLTEGGDIGTLLINTSSNSKLTSMFEEGKLFEMDSVVKKTITLRDIFTKGVIPNGSTDIFDSVTIEYPDIRLCDNKPTITGTFMHGSRKKLIGDYLETDFVYQPPSDSDSNSDSDSDSNVNNDNNDVHNNNVNNNNNINVNVDTNVINPSVFLSDIALFDCGLANANIPDTTNPSHINSNDNQDDMYSHNAYDSHSAYDSHDIIDIDEIIKACQIAE